MGLYDRLSTGSVIFVFLSFITTVADADILFVSDGSRISGQITEMTTTAIKIETSFAGEIAVPMENLIGVTSDNIQMVALRGGDRIKARPVYDPDAATQHLKDTSFGDLTIEADRLLGVLG